MSFIKVLVPLATLVAVAYSSEIGSFYFGYSFISHRIGHDLERAWRICPENTTNQEMYKPVLDETRSCYRNLTGGNLSICHSLEERVQKCSQPLVDFFVNCFPEKAKDLPPAISKAVTSLVEAFCTSPGDLLLETLNPCLYEYPNQRNNRTIKEECRKETLKPKLEKFHDDIPSKAEACKVFQEIGDCWQYSVNQDCGSLASKNLYTKFYSAALAGCK